MQCPICQNAQPLEIDLNAEGFASGVVKECGRCGAVWSKSNKEISMISVPKKTYVIATASNLHAAV